MAEFSLPITAEGAVTAPTGAFVFNEPSAESETFMDVGPVNTLEIPEFGFAMADGVNPLRLETYGTVYDAGGLAPSTAPTLAVAGGTRATDVGTWTGQPNPGDYLTIGLPGKTVTIYFLASISFDPYGTWQVLIDGGGDPDVTWTNFYNLINGTGTHGTDYFNVWTFRGEDDSFSSRINVEASAIDTGANTVTLRYTIYGVAGNACTAVISTTPAFANFTFASATFTGGTEGTGTAPGAGTYRYFYTWYRDADGGETGRSPIGEVTSGSSNNITVTVTASADTTYDYVRIYRTTNSGVEFFHLGDTPRGTLSYTDSIDDDTLTASDPSPWNDLEHRTYEFGPPPRCRALALWNGSIYAIGAKLHADYTKGTVAVAGPDTTASATITFSAKGVTSLMVGRTFQVDSTSETYRILSVSEGGPTAVLDRTYEGTTNAAATFKIVDDYDASRLRRCVPFLYNNWPWEESPGSVDTDDPEGGTALLATKTRLYAFSKTSITSVTGDDLESWEMRKMAEDVGCVAPRMVVGVEGGGVFLSTDGFYGLSPDESLVSISSPKVPQGTTARGIDDTVARIAWGNVDQGYSYYDHEDRIVIFGLPLDGAVVPNYELVFDLQNNTWALYKRAEWTACTRIILPNGDQALLAGDRDGNLWHVNIGESDGFYGTEAVQTLSGAQTVRVLTVSGTPYSTSGDGEDGKPVVILYADGSTVAYGKVASNTTAALTLCEDLATAPAASDQVILGGIAWQAKTGFATWGEEYDRKILRSVTVRHAPATRGEYFFSFAVDGGSYALCPVGTSIGDMTEGDGKIRHKVQWPGDSHSINLRGFKPGGQAVIRGALPDLVTREKGSM